MTGFDETVPDDLDPNRDASAVPLPEVANEGDSQTPDTPGLSNHSEPGDEPVVEPVDARDPVPDVNDGEAPQPMGGDDDLISGQYGPDR